MEEARPMDVDEGGASTAGPVEGARQLDNMELTASRVRALSSRTTSSRKPQR